MKIIYTFQFTSESIERLTNKPNYCLVREDLQQLCRSFVRLERFLHTLQPQIYFNYIFEIYYDVIVFCIHEHYMLNIVS